jgi:hypothetical protein
VLWSDIGLKYPFLLSSNIVLVLEAGLTDAFPPATVLLFYDAGSTDKQEEEEQRGQGQQYDGGYKQQPKTSAVDIVPTDAGCTTSSMAQSRALLVFELALSSCHRKATSPRGPEGQGSPPPARRKSRILHNVVWYSVSSRALLTIKPQLAFTSYEGGNTCTLLIITGQIASL